MATEFPSSPAERAAVTQELLADCVQRLAAGDVTALYDLSTLWMGHMHEGDTAIELGVAEGMVRYAAAAGSADAQHFLQDEWPAYRAILERRLRNRDTSKH